MQFVLDYVDVTCNLQVLNFYCMLTNNLISFMVQLCEAEKQFNLFAYIE